MRSLEAKITGLLVYRVLCNTNLAGSISNWIWTSYDFEDGNSFDNIEQKDDDDYLLIKKPAIIEPIIFMEPPVEQTLTLESLNELKAFTKSRTNEVTKVLVDLNTGDLINGI